MTDRKRISIAESNEPEIPKLSEDQSAEDALLRGDRDAALGGRPYDKTVANLPDRSTAATRQTALGLACSCVKPSSPRTGQQ
ncbi:hypothetical protein BSFA1_84960 (plasmid) [Burkholderia sp. SFA1]|nr:hypothetical protein BSFA1_84960 [Burkholderia sp. SFA1]